MYTMNDELFLKKYFKELLGTVFRFRTTEDPNDLIKMYSKKINEIIENEKEDTTGGLDKKLDAYYEQIRIELSQYEEQGTVIKAKELKNFMSLAEILKRKQRVHDYEKINHPNELTVNDKNVKEIIGSVPEINESEYPNIVKNLNTENEEVITQLDRLTKLISNEECLKYLKHDNQKKMLQEIEESLRKLWSILKNDHDKERNAKIYNILYKTSNYEQSIVNINRVQYGNSVGIYGPFSMVLYPVLIIPSELMNVTMKLYRQRSQDDKEILTALTVNIFTLEKNASCSNNSKGGRKKKMTLLKRKKSRKDRQKTKTRRSS